jgi:hypothetical protein
MIGHLINARAIKSIHSGGGLAVAIISISSTPQSRDLRGEAWKPA